MTEIQWLHIFGKNLKDILREYGYNQREFANEVGVSQATISNYIHCRQMPTATVLVKIAYVLNCSLDDLMDFGSTID